MARCMFCSARLDDRDADYLICHECEWFLRDEEAEAEAERELDAERQWERQEAARRRAKDRAEAAREARRNRRIEPERPGITRATVALPTLRKVRRAA